MRKLPVQVIQDLAKREDEFVKLGADIAEGLKGKEKDRQLRNLQSIAEESDSWAALELFIRYQAARNELDVGWAEKAIKTLQGLEPLARQSASGMDSELQKQVFMESVSRVLGYAVRWHVWQSRKPVNREKEPRRREGADA